LLSKILLRSRGPETSVKSSQLKSCGLAAEMNGACAAAATLETFSSRAMSWGWRENS
jgi:hypothetical protein